MQVNDAAAHTGSRDELVAGCAQALVDAFANYNAEFRAITQRARQRRVPALHRGDQRLRIKASPNSLHLTSVAPSIRRAKS